MTDNFRIALACTLASLISLHVAAAEDPNAPATDAVAVTVADPDVPLDELALMVKPMTADELKVEANAWMEMLRQKTLQTSQAELAIKQKNKSIEKAEEVQEAIEDTQAVLEEVQDASEEARVTGDLDAVEEAQAIAEEAQQAVEETVATIDSAIETRHHVSKSGEVVQALSVAEKTRVESLSENADTALEASKVATTAADKAVLAAEGGDSRRAARLSGESAEASTEATMALQDSSELIDEAIAVQRPAEEIVEQVSLTKTAAMAEAIAQQELEDKTEILVSVSELRTQRTAISDRLNVVLDELSAKLGTSAEGAENDFILPFRLYIASVNTIKVDVTDTQSFVSNMKGWLRSDVGGVRLAKQLSYFLLSVLSFWALGWVLGRLVDRALKITRITAELMRSVIVRSVRRITLMVGIIVGLAAMDINVGPILAVVGAAGFVIAFALQDTLSNFASGIMIMIYRPFDVGDLITVGGVTGRARSMNLVSTTIATEDNQLLVIPNNTVWRNIITNTTGSDTRRVDMVFRVGYDDDIEQAQRLLGSALESHPLVLKEPEPTIAVQNLGAISVDLICRPWARTEDYWEVYRSITRDVKERFQAAGLKPPYLQAHLQLPAPFPDNSAPGTPRPATP